MDSAKKFGINRIRNTEMVEDAKDIVSISICLYVEFFERGVFYILYF